MNSRAGSRVIDDAVGELGGVIGSLQYNTITAAANASLHHPKRRTAVRPRDG